MDSHNNASRSGFGLDDEGSAELAKAGKKAEPLLDQVLDSFYEHAGANPEMSRFFSDPQVLEHARAAQKKHWQLLLSGDFSSAYYESAKRVGRVHFRIELPFHLYLSGYSLATTCLQELLLQKAGPLPTGMQRKRAARMLSALMRGFSYDCHLVIDAYFEAQKEEQDLAFSMLTDGIERMASRDLSQPVPGPEESRYPVRYDAVRQTLNELMSGMNAVMGSIQDAVHSIDGSAGEVSQAAEDLSRRTETQAATLEQTAAAVEEITVSMRNAAEATSETDQKVGETRSNAEESREVVQSAVSKMQEIEDSSNQISQIISVIDDIAFQTNLLALNAGVEAARAGESGRGFAVVASEVRALAQRAADSAKEIKDLIAVSSGHVEDGVAMVGQAGDALSRMAGDISRAAELTSEVASSSQEQATGLSEINTGVAHLDQVTQQNAAMVEETTAAIMTMQKDTGKLSQLLGSFTVGTNMQPAALRTAAE